MPNYGAAQAWTEYASDPREGRAIPIHLPRGGAVQTIGQASDNGSQPTTTGYMLASTLGAAIGGGLIGFISSGSYSGALNGATFAGALASFADARFFYKTGQSGTALTLLAVGAGSLSLSLWRFGRMRTRAGRSRERRRIQRWAKA